jgi:hypothetical protein
MRMCLQVECSEDRFVDVDELYTSTKIALFVGFAVFIGAAYVCLNAFAGDVLYGIGCFALFALAGAVTMSVIEQLADLDISGGIEMAMMCAVWIIGFFIFLLPIF